MALATELQGNPQRPRRRGVALWAAPPGGGFTLVFEMAPDSGGSPGAYAEIATRTSAPAKGCLVPVLLPDDGAVRWFRVKARAALYADSVYLGPVSSTPYDLEGLLSGDVDEANLIVFPTIGGPGSLKTGVTQTDGVAPRALSIGIQRGTAADGAAVTFPTPYQNVPKVRLAGGLLYEPRGGQWSGTFDSTKPQYEDFAALNVTAAGFTVRARLRQVGAPTLRAQDFTAAVLDAPGEVEALTLGNAPANNDTYDVRAWVRISLRSKTGALVQGTVTYAIDSSSDSGGSWVERATVAEFHVTTDTASDDVILVANTRSIVVSGLDTTDQIRLRFISFVVTGLTIGNPVGEVVGADNGGTYAGRGVTYYNSTDIFATKTPSTGDAVTWEAGA